MRSRKVSKNYSDVIMSAMASQITGLSIVSFVQTQTKDNSKAPFPFDDVIMSMRVFKSLWNWARCTVDRHDDVIKWKHFPRYWPFVRGIHQSPVNYPHKGQWPGSLMFYLICAWINGWLNNREAGELRRHRAHYDVIVMACQISKQNEQNDPIL